MTLYCSFDRPQVCVVDVVNVDDVDDVDDVLSQVLLVHKYDFGQVSPSCEFLELIRVKEDLKALPFE